MNLYFKRLLALKYFARACAILVLVGLISGSSCTIAQIIKGLKYGKLADRLIDWNPEKDWETPLSEVGKKLGILLLID